MMKNIYIVEDDLDLLSLLVRYFDNRYSVHSFDNGFEAIKSFSISKCDLLIVDMGLPGASGNHVISSLKDYDPTVPVIAISGQSCFESKYYPYKCGATHFLQKPFDMSELVEIIKSMFQFISHFTKSNIKIADLVIDTGRSIALCNNEIIKLSQLEFKILLFLASNFEEVVSRDQIIDFCWIDDQEQDSDRIVDYQISRIRKKISKCRAHIVSEYSKGYSLRFRI